MARQLSMTRMTLEPEEETGTGELMRKSKSLHDLKKKAAEEPKPLVVADKIDDFLQTVNEQQEALNKMLEERRLKKGGSVSRGRANGIQRASPHISANKKAIKPKTFSKPAAIPVIDATRITSKLKTDRNYQPPRRQKALKIPAKVQHEPLAHEDYGDDFESEEEQEEEEEDLHVVAKQKEAWLYDQMKRSRARQKAALLRKQFHHEKESSKDSAYGFSGGENSRLHTREPTPDANNHVQPRLIQSRLKGPPNSYRKQMNPLQSKTNKSSELKDYDPGLMDFLDQVTREIISRGLYTEKAIMKAVEGQMDRQSNLSVKQKAEMVQRVKLDLGLDQRKKEALIASRTGSTSEESGSPMRIKRPVTAPTVTLQKSTSLSSPDDDSLRSLLKDESDQEIIEILRSTRKKAKELAKKPSTNTDALLTSSLNLTNLNVSFNSSNIQEAKRKLEESRTQALLVKSFAYDKNESSEAEEDQDSRSSSLPKSGSERSLEEKYESDFIQEQVESESASEVQEEDLP